MEAKSQQSTKTYISEGELFPWKGFWWRVVTFRPEKDKVFQVTYPTSDDHEAIIRGASERPLLVLELVKPLKDKKK